MHGNIQSKAMIAEMMNLVSSTMYHLLFIRSVSLFILPSFMKEIMTTVVGKIYVPIGILFANSCIWLDSLFSHSGVLFKNHNHTSTNSNETNSTIAMQAIEKTDPFLSPAMIEFSLMAIDMLFTKTDDYDEDSLQIDPKNPENTTCCNCETCRYACRLFRLIGQISLSLVAFALFAFTFSVFLKPTPQKNY